MTTPYIDPKEIFASDAPNQDKPARFDNYTKGMDETRKNNGRPTIKQANFLQQKTDQKILYIHERGAALPYVEGFPYEENAIVVRDGVLVQKKGDEWKPVGVNKASDILDESGLTQQEINNLRPISFDDYKIDSTGLTPVDDKIIQAFNDSFNQKRPLENFKGTYLLDGNQVIKIRNNYDLTGTTFVIGSNFTGNFEISRNPTINDYDASSSLIAKIKAGGVLAKGACKIDALSSDPTLDDTFIQLYSSQYMYTYRGVAQTRIEFDRFYKYGQIESGFFYPLDLSTVTRIRAQKVMDSVFYGKGLTIDETNLSVQKTLVYIQNGNRFDLRDFRFIDKSTVIPSVIKNRIGISVDTHDVTIDGVNTSSAYIDSSSFSNYTIWTGGNYKLTFRNIQSDGYGWGSFGMNSCKNVTIENSQVNRIDFHNPCHNYLKIDNCTIGNWGVLVTMIGDLFIRNSKFLQRNGYNNSGIIRTRTDTGGWCNGDLYWENNIVEGASPLALIPLIICQGNHTQENGSPVVAEVFSNVYIDGLHAKGNTSYLSRLFSIPSTFTDTTNMLPKSVIVKNLSVEDGAIQPLNINASFFRKRDSGVVLEYHDCKCNYLSLTDASSVGTQFDVTLKNCTGVGFQNGMTVTNTANATISSTNSTIKNYVEIVGGASSEYAPVVRFNGGRLINTASTIYIDTQNTQKDRIRFCNVDFTYGSSPELINDLAFFTPVSCTFNNRSYIYVYEGAAKASHGFSVPSACSSIKLLVRANNQESITHVYLGAANTITASNASIAVTVSSGTANIVVTATNITVVGISS